MGRQKETCDHLVKVFTNPLKLQNGPQEWLMSPQISPRICFRKIGNSLVEVFSEGWSYN